MAKLTRTLVDHTTSPKSGTMVIMDDVLPNFGLRVSSSGTRSYFVRLRVGGGRRAQQRRVTIGRADFMSPDEARKLAREHLAHAHLGKDPGSGDRPYRSAIDEPEVFSLLGASLLRTGWSADLAVLSAPCLVVRPGFDHYV